MDWKDERKSITFGDPSPQPNVQVTMPANIAYDFDRFVEVQRSVLERLGCPACTSGFDIRWQLQRQFFVNVEGRIMDTGF